MVPTLAVATCPALAAAVGLTYGSEEVAVLGKSHEGLRQLPKPLLEHSGDGMDGEVLQLDGCGVCGEAGDGAGERRQGGCAPAPSCPLPPDTHLSAVPVGAPACGWQRPTCGRGPRCTGRASPHVPEASPAQQALRPCHWSGCPRTRRSGLARRLARSAVPEVGGGVRSPVWALPSLPLTPPTGCWGRPAGEVSLLAAGQGLPLRSGPSCLRVVGPASAAALVLGTLPPSRRVGDALLGLGRGRAGGLRRAYKPSPVSGDPEGL